MSKIIRKKPKYTHSYQLICDNWILNLDNYMSAISAD